jgi:hypothetical protein
MRKVNANGNGVRDATDTLDFSGFNEIEGFDLLHYRTKEENFASSNRR